MKMWSTVVLAMTLTACMLGLPGCSTVGGAVSGAGEDLKKAGDWIKNR